MYTGVLYYIEGVTAVCALKYKAYFLYNYMNEW